MVILCSALFVGFIAFAYFVFGYVAARIIMFFSIFGIGLEHGSAKSQLPDVHADFAFSVAGEELFFCFFVVSWLLCLVL